MAKIESVNYIFVDLFLETEQNRCVGKFLHNDNFVQCVIKKRRFHKKSMNSFVGEEKKKKQNEVNLIV